MTVFCLVELDGDAVADASLRALTLARGLAAGASATLAAGSSGPGHRAWAGSRGLRSR